MTLSQRYTGRNLEKAEKSRGDSLWLINASLHDCEHLMIYITIVDVLVFKVPYLREYVEEGVCHCENVRVVE